MTDVLSERDELVELADAAEALVGAAEADMPSMSSEARVVLERLQQKKFGVAVVGEFNRGKSTLVNTLLGKSVLPSGALPVTAVTTEVSYGDEEAVTVSYIDRAEEVIDLRRIEDFATEEANPANTLKVDTVHVRLPVELLRRGTLLVDTPGLNSIFRQSTEAAADAILAADGAVVCLSADAPLTDTERSLLKLLSRRSAQTFFVLNRIDLVSRDDLERVSWFVDNVLTELYGCSQKIYRVSAKTGEGIEAFVGAFNEFLDNGLDEARLELACRDLVTLADRIDNACSLEASALTLNAEELDVRLTDFRRAVGWQRDAFADDKVLFEHAVARIADNVGERLQDMSDEALATIEDSLEQAALDAPLDALATTLDELIDSEMRKYFEPVRQEQEDEVERAWAGAAERFQRATHRRTDKLREIAGEMFDVKLHPIAFTRPAEQEAHFFYSSPEVLATSSTIFERLLSPLMGEPRRRKQMVTAATARLRTESQRHCARLREDLTTRLTDAMADLETAMGERVDEVAEAMTRAIEKAQESKTSLEVEVAAQHTRAQRLRQAITTVREATALDL